MPKGGLRPPNLVGSPSTAPSRSPGVGASAPIQRPGAAPIPDLEAAAATQALTGANQASVSSTQRVAPRTIGAFGLQAAQLVAARQDVDEGPKLARSGKAVVAALNGDGAASIVDERPLDLLGPIERANVTFDSLHARVPVGDYAGIDFRNLPDDHPALDLKIYRGMSSSDPAVHALLTTGHLVPQGRGGDYEGFKRYDHREPLDAYEWTLDPYLAMSRSGGHGYLVETSLRELRDQGLRNELGRKVGDSEGGIFIAANVRPRVRVVEHHTDRFDLKEVRPLVREDEQALAKTIAGKLGGAVVEAGGWEGFMGKGGIDPSLPEKDRKLLNGMRLRVARHKVDQSLDQIDYYGARIREVDPSNTRFGQLRMKLVEAKLAEDGMGKNIGQTLGTARRTLEAVKMLWVTMDPGDVANGSNGVWEIG